MKRILVIDDLRIFEPLEGEEIVHVRTWQEGERQLDTCSWDEVWLDWALGHDEHGEQLTMKFLVDQIEAWTVEGYMSMNDIGMFVSITDEDYGRRYMLAALSPHYPIEVGKREFRINWDETPA